MTPFQVYENYIAIKTHFNTSKYDYIKMNGKVSVRRSTYENRKDKKMFERLANKNMDYVIPFMIANFVANKNLWIGDLVLNSESITTYFDWKRKQAIIYTETKEELENIKDFLNKHDKSFNDLFTIDEEKLPIIFRLMIQRFISLETYMILDLVLNFTKSYESLLDNPLYKQWELKTRKYALFLILDKKRCKTIIHNVFC